MSRILGTYHMPGAFSYGKFSLILLRIFLLTSNHYNACSDCYNSNACNEEQPDWSSCLGSSFACFRETACKNHSGNLFYSYTACCFSEAFCACFFCVYDDIPFAFRKVYGYIFAVCVKDYINLFCDFAVWTSEKGVNDYAFRSLFFEDKAVLNFFSSSQTECTVSFTKIDKTFVVICYISNACFVVPLNAVNSIGGLVAVVVKYTWVSIGWLTLIVYVQ